MFAPARGLALTFVCFAAAFALHIVGGATGQGWLFAIAVALIFVFAAGFSGFALWMAGLARAGTRAAQATDLAGGVIGSALLVGAFWAANGRAFAPWQFVVAPLIEAAISFVVVLVICRVGLGADRASLATS